MPHHSCARNVLLARETSSDKWFKIRDRTFQSRHIDQLSASATADPPVRCSANDLFCPFPHNDIESFLWRKEIEGEFDVFQMIVNEHVNGMNACDNVCSRFMSKYGGEIKQLCISCSVKDQNTGLYCSGEPSHMCKSNRMLAHMSLLKSANPFVLWMPHIEPEFFHTRKLCSELSSCPAVKRKCLDMHSFLERDFATLIRVSRVTDAERLAEILNAVKRTKVMELERDASWTGCWRCSAPEFQTGASNDELVTDAITVNDQRATPGADCVAAAAHKRASKMTNRESSSTATADNAVARTVSKSDAPSARVDQFGNDAEDAHRRGDDCRFKFVIICRDCWENNSGSIQEYNDERKLEKCPRGHCWKDSRAVMETSGKKVLIKPLPKKLPTNCDKLQECKNKMMKKGCEQSDCQFAHSAMEVDVWKWQVKSTPRSEYR